MLRSGSFVLGDLADLLLGDLADLVLVRLARALLDASAAFLRRIAAGGVLMMNVNERSEYTVMTTGMIRSSFACACVLALNSLQNSMMLTPC